MQQFSSSPMLHSGIYKSYMQKTEVALAQKGVELLQSAGINRIDGSVPAMFSRIAGKDFLANPLVHEEIFGPWTLLVVCENAAELLACRQAVAGQLTTSLWGNDEDFASFTELIEGALYGAGRVVFNGAPTGVEVCHAMVHGGPHPATTDSRFTAVGPMAISRWTRPVCWQNAPQHILPPALQEDNPLNLLRLVDGQWIK
jgi:NADP-dependent aldehyde dehydrogenase